MHFGRTLRKAYALGKSAIGGSYHSAFGEVELASIYRRIAIAAITVSC